MQGQLVLFLWYCLCVNWSGSDANGDNLTYTWEQTDLQQPVVLGIVSAITTKPDGPLFRSFILVQALWGICQILVKFANKLTSRWESVSSVARTLNFALTARDNAALGTAQTNTDTTVVNVSGAIGPFVIHHKIQIHKLGIKEITKYNLNKWYKYIG
jgi:hypothetical protein